MIAAALAATALAWMALGIVAGLSLMPAGVLAGIATLGCASMVGIVRSGDTREPRKRMIAAGTIRPKRQPETWSVSYGTEALRISRYTTTVNDSGPPSVREREAV